MWRQVVVRNVRLFSTAGPLRKDPITTAKDALKSVDRTVSQGAVKGIEKGEEAVDAAKQAAGIGKDKAQEAAGEVQGKAQETRGTVQGKAQEAAGTVQGKAQEAKAEADKKM